MKVKLLVLAVAVLAMASLTFAQGLVFYNETWVMTKNCDSTGGPIPLDWPVWIMNDCDADGYGTCTAPDDDPLAVLCDVPYDCETGPQGTVSRQQFPMGEGTGTAGTFATDPALMGSGGVATCPKFYLKVEYVETTYVPPIHNIHHIRYLSKVSTMPADIADVDLAGAANWTRCCWDSTWSDIQECVPDLYTQFSPIPPPGGDQPLNFHDCAAVCINRPHVVSVGPVAAANRLPHGFVLPGCDPFSTPCDSDCVPAAGWTFGPLVWVFRTDETGLWYDAIITSLPGATDGCICIVVDFIEAVEIGEVAVVPLSNSVKITWRTRSEDANLDGFAIYRDGSRLTTLDATNTPSGASYVYVDNNVENGRTYNYDLRSVDINGAESSFHTASVTPSFENAAVTQYALHQNYPNPFNPSTKIAFDVVGTEPVTVTIYNATGQLVKTLLNGEQRTNRSFVMFDSGNLTSGLYFYTVKIGNEFTATKKMLLVK
ncbi:MAG: T9SS type A sorting domain-containing protein [bacterium]|nr:T9SS type A sorting domain-containing protein [bacterium]